MLKAETLQIESYTISQNNIEDVFVAFVRDQLDSSESILKPVDLTNLCPVASSHSF